MAVAEGIPLDTPPGLVVTGARLRLERDRQMFEALSLSISAGIKVNLVGGDTDMILRPFYSDREWREMERRNAEVREEIAQRQQLAKLRKLMGGQK